MSYLKDDWCGLHWSPWISFQASRNGWSTLPTAPGLYRIRPAMKNLIVYVGETGRGLRDRLTALKRGVLSESMPFNDPHTAAPNLWAWRQEENFEYECSASVFLGSVTERKSLECLLLWKYRLEKGESTLCNYGRFHKNYVKSRNRSTGERGFRLAADQENPSGGPRSTPLKPHGNPTDPDWMNLNWSELVPLSPSYSLEIPEACAMYRIVSDDRQSLLYIGESNSLRSRFIQHCNSFGKKGRKFSFMLTKKMAKYQLHELETDLIASYYHQMSAPPKYQFSASRKPI